jgi:acyl carrier protein
MDIRAEVEKFLLTEVATGIDKKSLAPDEDLLMQGIIDSLGILKLVLFMEKSFGIKINNEEMIPENFQTLNALAEFVEKKT